MKNLNRFPAALIAAAFILSSAGCGQTEEKPVITTESYISYDETTATAEESSVVSETTVTSEEPADNISDRDTISERKASASDKEKDISSDIQARDNEPETSVVTEVSETVSSKSEAAVTTAPESETETEKTTAAAKNEKLPAPKKFDGSYLDFFSNSLFIGDSICSGLKVYGGFLDAQHVAARASVATRTIKNYTFPYMNNSTKEMHDVDIVEYYQPDDIFIWMGMNDLLCINYEKYGDNMKTLADNYLKVSPNSRIHIVSMSPMSSTHKWNIEYNGNSKINTYNKRLQYVCDHTDYMDYININDYLSDENGYLASEYNGGDGIHLSPAAYKVVLNQICAYMTDVVYAEQTEPEETEENAVEETAVTEAPEADGESSETPAVTTVPYETEETKSSTETSSETEDEKSSDETTKSKAEEFKEYFFKLKNK